MKKFANRQFLSLFDDDSAATFADRTMAKARFQRLVDGLANLRDIGVADPD
jgi:hypothetical protein